MSFFLQRWAGDFCEDDLQCGTHMGFEQMPGKRRPISASEDSVNVQAWLVVGTHCDVTNKRGNLDLLANWSGLIGFGLPIEVGELAAAQGSDGCDLRGPNALASRKILETPNGLVPGLKDDCESAPTVALMEEL